VTELERHEPAQKAMAGRVHITTNGQLTETLAEVFVNVSGARWHVRFAESAVQTTICTINGGAQPSLRVRRFGESQSAYAFTPGKWEKGFWKLAEGQLPLWIWTHRLHSEMCDVSAHMQIEAYSAEKPLADKELESAQRLSIHLAVSLSADE